MRANVAAAGTILVVEDEPHVRELVLRTLRGEGWSALAAETRVQVLAALERTRCAAVVLDLGLPGDDGISIARVIRERSDVPILILTGRGGIHARLSGFEAGADDYVVKPFAPEELVARLRALLRRTAGRVERRAVDAAMHLGEGKLDLRSRMLAGPAGSVRLTEREAKILLALGRAAGPLARSALARAALAGRAWNPEDRSLDVHITHVRQKLRRALGRADCIATLRSEGYELRVPVWFEEERN